MELAVVELCAMMRAVGHSCAEQVQGLDGSFFVLTVFRDAGDAASH